MESDNETTDSDIQAVAAMIVAEVMPMSNFGNRHERIREKAHDRPVPCTMMRHVCYDPTMCIRG